MVVPTFPLKYLIFSQFQIKYYAVLAAMGGGVPIPGVSLCSDKAILANQTKRYHKELCLDEESLENLASKHNKPVAILKQLAKGPCASVKHLMEKEGWTTEG